MKIVNVPPLGAELQHIPYRISDNKVYVKYHQDGVQAGFPSPAEDFKEVPLSLDEKYLENPESTYLVRVVGESMTPTLQVNDILVVKANTQLNHNQIAIVSVNQNEFTVKRYNQQQRQLIADNPQFQPISIKEDDTLICLGVVKHLIRDL